MTNENYIDHTDLLFAMRTMRVRKFQKLFDLYDRRRRINDRIRDLLHRRIVQAGGNIGDNGEREKTKREINDLRSMAYQEWQGFAANWRACKNNECGYWENCNRCVDRQRAGVCPAKERRHN